MLGTLVGEWKGARAWESWVFDLMAALGTPTSSTWRQRNPGVVEASVFHSGRRRYSGAWKTGGKGRWDPVELAR